VGVYGSVAEVWCLAVFLIELQPLSVPLYVAIHLVQLPFHQNKINTYTNRAVLSTNTILTLAKDLHKTPRTGHKSLSFPVRTVTSLSARTHSWKNSASIGQILMKFDMGVFFKNVSREFKFH